MKGLTINKVKIGDKVRNLKTGNIGVIRNNIAPFIHHYDWVEVLIEKSLNGKTFIACWSLKNLELVKPENTDSNERNNH